jgi:hypothetical protein
VSGPIKTVGLWDCGTTLKKVGQSVKKCAKNPFFSNIQIFLNLN